MTALIQTLAVAEYLSFNRAAKALGTSQSSISSRIKALEEDLGVTLFDRNTRGVRLTEAGRRFVSEVDEAIEILDHAIKTAAMQANGEEGQLRIGVHVLAAGTFLDRLLKRFHLEHPGVYLRISEGTARDAQILLREGKLDVAFMVHTHEISDLHSRIIWHDRLMAALPPRHPFAKLPHVEWRQLAEQTLIVRTGGPGPQLYDLIIQRSTGKWSIPTIVRQDVGYEGLLSMIAAGQGISFLVQELGNATNADISFVPIKDEDEAVVFSAVWSPVNRNPALSYLLNLASDRSRL